MKRYFLISACLHTALLEVSLRDSVRIRRSILRTARRVPAVQRFPGAARICHPAAPFKNEGVLTSRVPVRVR
jgi:hypothetical protein